MDNVVSLADWKARQGKTLTGLEFIERIANLIDGIIERRRISRRDYLISVLRQGRRP